ATSFGRVHRQTPGERAISVDVINLPPPGRKPVPLRHGAAQIIWSLRLNIMDLDTHKRVNREQLTATIRFAIEELELGLRHEADDATRDLSQDLLRALRPEVTVAEIEGARAILELILAALPDYRVMDTIKQNSVPSTGAP